MRSTSVFAPSPPLRWLPRASRIVGWGALMSFLWATGGLIAQLVAVIGIWELNFVYHWIPDNADMDSTGFFLALAIVVTTMILGAKGALVGGVAGAYAPEITSNNPLQAPFFRSIGWRTLACWLLCEIGAGTILYPLRSLPIACLWLLLTPLLYAFALRWALRSSLPTSTSVPV